MDQAFEDITDNQIDEDNQIDQDEQAILVDYIDPDDIEKERDDLLFKCNNIEQECFALSKKHYDLLKEHTELSNACDNQQELIEKTEKLNIELNEKLKKEQKSTDDIDKESRKKDLLIELLNNKLINSQKLYDILMKQYTELSDDIAAKKSESDRHFNDFKSAELKIEQQKRKTHLREIESVGNRHIVGNLEKDISENRKKTKEYELEIYTIKNQHKILLKQQYNKYGEYMKEQHDKHREDMKEQKRRTHLREIESYGSKYVINGLEKDINENRKKIKENEAEMYTMMCQYKMDLTQQHRKNMKEEKRKTHLREIESVARKYIIGNLEKNADENRKKIKENEAEMYTMINQYKINTEQQYDKYKQDAEQQYDKYKQDTEQQYSKYKSDLEQRQKIIDKLSTDYATKNQEFEKYRKMWEQSQETIKQYQSMSSQLQTACTKSQDNIRQYKSMYEELNKKYLDQTREQGRLQAKVTMYEYKPSQPQPYRPIQLNQVRPVQELRPLVSSCKNIW